jgi:periplasmic divalent cation tolerance protein
MALHKRIESREFVSDQELNQSHPNQVAMVLTTTDSQAVAESIANELVSNKLAACVQIDGPIKSIYTWKDKLTSSQELRLSIKTTQANIEKLIASIKTLHNYELPQIIAIPITGGNDDYLKWVAALSQKRDLTEIFNKRGVNE